MLPSTDDALSLMVAAVDDRDVSSLTIRADPLARATGDRDTLRARIRTEDDADESVVERRWSETVHENCHRSARLVSQ